MKKEEEEIGSGILDLWLSSPTARQFPSTFVEWA